MAANYNGAELVDAPSQQYNCHAYEWHVSEGGNKVWIGMNTVTAEDVYWTDGSYIEVPESYATKVSYHQDGNHSAIRLNSTWYQSKWGSTSLVKHHPNDVPSIYQPSKTQKYYIKKPIISGPSSICASSSSGTGGVEVRACNSCGCSEWKWITAVYGPCSQYSMSASPNPANSTLNVDITSNCDAAPIQATPQSISTNGQSQSAPQISTYEIKLYNSMGTLALQTTAPAGSILLDVSSLPSGLYILHVHDGSDNPPQTQNIIISH